MKYFDQSLILPTQTAPPISKKRKTALKTQISLVFSHKDNNGPAPESAQRTKGRVKALSGISIPQIVFKTQSTTNTLSLSMN